MNRRALLLAFILTTLVVFAAPVSASDLSGDLAEVRSRIDDVRSQMTDAAAQQSDLAKQVVAAGEELDAAERDLAAVTARIERLNGDIASRSDALDAIRTELASQFQELASLREMLAGARADAEHWALEAYMAGGVAQPSIAFSVGGMNDIAVGVAYLNVLTGDSNRTAERYTSLVAAEEEKEALVRASEDRAEEELAGLEDLWFQLAEVQAEEQERQGMLERAYEGKAELLAKVEARIEEFEGELAAFEREEASIRARIAAAAAPTVVTTSTGRARPVPGAVSSGFGMRVHPILGTSRMHNGWDMNAAHGDPIRAYNSGRVILAGPKGGYGNTVMIDHGGGVVTLYAHQSKMAVSNGDSVEMGQVIGYIGSTGLSTGPHLHFEIRINGTPVDPDRYL